MLDFLDQEYQLSLKEYSEASVRRRITKMLNEFGLDRVEKLCEFLQSRSDGKQLFIEKFTVNVTEMFRDPHFYKALEDKVISVLKSRENIRIWAAGCSSGEEILSLCILLYEMDLLHKCHILGTDLNSKMLDEANNRTYKTRHVSTYMKPYLYAGGRYGLEKYFTTHGENAIFHAFLHENVSFKEHNLMEPLGEEPGFDLIVCRNVLIYFKSTLQNRVIAYLDKALRAGGFLGLGSKESIIFYHGKNHFKEIDLESKIYQKI